MKEYIKEKHVHEFIDTVFTKKKDITLDEIRRKIESAAKTEQVPLAFSDGQIGYGGIFSYSSEDCLVLYHPGHKRDYSNSV